MSKKDARRYRLPYCIGDRLDRAKMANADSMHVLGPLLTILERGGLPDKTDLINRISRLVRNIAANDTAVREIELIQAVGKDKGE